MAVWAKGGHTGLRHFLSPFSSSLWTLGTMQKIRSLSSKLLFDVFISLFAWQQKGSPETLLLLLLYIT